MIKQKLLLILPLVVVLLITACVPAVIPTSLAPAPPASPPAAHPSPSSTVTPTPTQTVTASPLPSLTITQTITPTSTPTPTLDFRGFQVQFVEFRDFGMVMGLVIPGITAPYMLVVNNQEFSCTMQSGIANRLFCYGSRFPVGAKVKLAFFQPGVDAPIFQTDYVISLPGTPTPDYYKLTRPDCPVRGINARCETENRIADNGNCVVSTCVDSCGYWYSIDTCYYSTPFVAPIDQTRAAQTATAAASP